MSVSVTNEQIEDVASRLDLRQPNKEALQTLAYEMDRHFEVEKGQAPWEAVIDSATGMGKTFIAAAAIDYYAALGTRNFAIIAPGRTILNKTVSNFTLGDPKSVVDGMAHKPVVITSENFDTAAMRAVMEDSEQVKLYVFTVQSLLRPGTKQGRRTHEFQEGLGEAFYTWLDELEDLLVLADEHHVYHAPAFSAAIRDLTPKALIGLTATPNERQLERAGIPIIYRYPLAQAIADKFVKTPVLVGRKDDRSDTRTKIQDGLRLLEAKEASVAAYCDETGAEPINPIMLIVAPSIEEADEVGALLREPAVAGGRYGDHVLVVHSDAPDEALEKLEVAEDPASGIRVIVSVGMLREGWDNKSVYVICSLRASISDVLTEQTMGRGLRLPFGSYTQWEMLDTLEIVAHESYERLLKRADVINEQFIDWRTRAVERRNAKGEKVTVIEQEPVSLTVVQGTEEAEPDATQAAADGEPTITSVEQRTKEAEAEAKAAKEPIAPKPDAPEFRLPVLRMTAIENQWSLNNITDLAQFRDAGQRIATNPETELRRIKLSAHPITGPDGLRRTELKPSPPIDKIEAQMNLIPLEEARKGLVDALMAAPITPGRKGERAGADRLVGAFIDGLGDEAEKLLSAYPDRASARVIALVSEEQLRSKSAPTYGEKVESKIFDGARKPRSKSSTDRTGKFAKSVGYLGYKKSVFESDWFDSSTERTVANILDDEDSITAWLRLQRGDLEIAWEAGAYNPDFAAIAENGCHYLIEVKADYQMGADSVQRKREAARRWTNHVNASEEVPDEWSYILASENDIVTARGSWAALKNLAG